MKTAQRKKDTRKHGSDPNEMKLRPSTAKHTSRAVSPKSVLTIVKHKNGTRVAIDQHVVEKIGDPTHVQISYGTNVLVIGEKIDPKGSTYPLKTLKNKKVIYSSALVDEITAAFDIKFSQKSSLSFQDVSYRNIKQCPCAMFTMPKSIQSSELHSGSEKGEVLKLGDKKDRVVDVNQDEDDHDEKIDLEDSEDTDDEDDLEDGEDTDDEDDDLEDGEDTDDEDFDLEDGEDTDDEDDDLEDGEDTDDEDVDFDDENSDNQL